jgi:hypothetical protein
MESLVCFEAFIDARIHQIPSIAPIDTGFAYGVVKQSRYLP